MGSQVLVPFRGSEDSPRHLKLMGDLGQVTYNIYCLFKSFIFGDFGARICYCFLTPYIPFYTPRLFQ